MVLAGNQLGVPTSTTYSTLSSSVISYSKSPICRLAIYGGEKGSGLPPLCSWTGNSSSDLVFGSKRGGGSEGFFCNAGQSLISNWIDVIRAKSHIRQKLEPQHIRMDDDGILIERIRNQDSTHLDI